NVEVPLRQGAQLHRRLLRHPLSSHRLSSLLFHWLLAFLCLSSKARIFAMSSVGLYGFERKSSAPSSIPRARSLSCPFAESRMIGTSFSDSSRRIASLVAKPS